MYFTASLQSYKKLQMIRILFLSIGSLLFSTNAYSATVLVDDNFDSGTTAVLGSQSGGSVSISTDTSQNYNNSAGSVRGNYPTPTGGSYGWAVYYFSGQNINEVLIEFDAKMPNAKQGLKFLKIFGGASSNTNYNNTTFSLDYAASPKGGINQIGFGDGVNTANDSQNVINLNGSYPEWIGRSYGNAIVNTPQGDGFPVSLWGTGWHNFKFYVKYNSGTTPSNEVADGAFYLEVDGKIYAHATGLFNRHYSNMPIDRIELFGWAQGGGSAFDIWYDNVKITTGTGIPQLVMPNSPTQLQGSSN